MNAPPAARNRHAAGGTVETRALAFLADLSQALAVSLDLKRTLSEAVNRVADFMQAEAASLFLLDPASAQLECRICAGPVDLNGLRVAVGQGVVGAAVAANACQLVADASRDPRVHRAADAKSGFVTRNLLCAPLSTADGPIGAIEVINKRGGGSFDAADAEILRLVAAPTALAINNARMAFELLEQQRLKREFELARRLQKSLLPRRRRDGFPILAVNLPAHEISGDFYDYFERPDGRIGFVIGDVSGKGMDAALLMVRAASLLRWIGMGGDPPGDWLARANAELCETASEGRFVCALVGDCDRACAAVRFAGAGFPPALLHGDGAFREFPAGGPPLGIVPGVAYEETALALGGGALYCFSDGATDVRDAAGATIGAAGVRALVERHAGAAPEARLRALVSELKHLSLVDDTTILLVEATRMHADEILLDRRFPARADQLREVRAELRRALNGVGVEAGLRDRLVLVVDEACANIIRHAYGPERRGDIELRITRKDGVLTFELGDTAPPIDPACVRARPLGECRPGGLGVALIDEVMDDWRVTPRADGRGNRLTMSKRIDTGGAT